VYKIIFEELVDGQEAMESCGFSGYRYCLENFYLDNKTYKRKEPLGVYFLWGLIEGTPFTNLEVVTFATEDNHIDRGIIAHRILDIEIFPGTS